MGSRLTNSSSTKDKANTNGKGKGAVVLPKKKKKVAPPIRNQTILSAEELEMDEATWLLLRAMQNRDITPNDYSVLSELDNRVKPKGLEGAAFLPKATVVTTTATTSANNTPTDTTGHDSTTALQAADVCDDAGVHHRLDPRNSECLVCYGDFEIGQVVRRVNCTSGHVFHANCIDKWLEEATRCPVDREELPQLTCTTAPVKFDYAAPCSLCVATT